MRSKPLAQHLLLFGSRAVPTNSQELFSRNSTNKWPWMVAGGMEDGISSSRLSKSIRHNPGLLLTDQQIQKLKFDLCR